MRVISTRNWTGSLVCLLLVLFFAGCSCGPGADVSPPTDIPLPTSTPSPPELDTSLLTDDPCRAPCWYNIVPGVSSEEEARAQLQDNPLIKQGTLKYEEYEVDRIPDSTFSKFYWQARGGRYNVLHFQDGVASGFWFYIDHDWTLGDAVEKFGPPEYVYASLDGVEEVSCAVMVFYPAQGLRFDLYLYPPGMGECLVTQDLKVFWAEYFAPTTLEGMFGDVDWLADVHEWEGFGEVELAR